MNKGICRAVAKADAYYELWGEAGNAGGHAEVLWRERPSLWLAYKDGEDLSTIVSTIMAMFGSLKTPPKELLIETVKGLPEDYMKDVAGDMTEDIIRKSFYLLPNLPLKRYKPAHSFVEENKENPRQSYN